MLLLRSARRFGQRSFSSPAALTQKVQLPDDSIDSPRAWLEYISSAYIGKIPPKKVYLTELLQSCTEESHAKVAVSALELFKSKRQQVCKDNSSLFVTKCCDLGVPEIAYGVIARKRHSPIHRSSITAASLNELIKALMDAEMLDMCFKLNNIALKLNIDRDSSTFSCLVRACVDASDHLRLIKMMRWESPHKNQWWDSSIFQFILDADWSDDQKTELAQNIEEFWIAQPDLKSEANEAIRQTWASEKAGDATDETDDTS